MEYAVTALAVFGGAILVGGASYGLYCILFWPDHLTKSW